MCTWRVECGKEELLAKAVTIDGHKEWYCRLLRDENTMFRAFCVLFAVGENGVYDRSIDTSR